MAGVQSIIDRIIQDAKMQADSIQEAANRQTAEFEKEADIGADEAVREILDKAEADCREEERRFRAIMDLETRKDTLAKKRGCIDRAFEKAKEIILHLEESKYRDFLFGLMKKCAQDGGSVFYSKRDERFFDGAFFEKAKAEINPEIAPGGVRDSLSSGFILVCGDITVNCSLDSVIRQARDELESDVARILFER